LVLIPCPFGCNDGQLTNHRGFSLLVKVSFGSAYEVWVDHAKVQYGRDKSRFLAFAHPVVVTMPKYIWESKASPLLLLLRPPFLLHSPPTSLLIRVTVCSPFVTRTSS